MCTRVTPWPFLLFSLALLPLVEHLVREIPTLVANALDRRIPRVREEGFKLLGAPIGSHTFEDDTLEEKVHKLDQLMDKLSLLEDPHTEYAMQKSCFALPKLSFLMRPWILASTRGPWSSSTHQSGRVWRGCWGSPCWTTCSCPGQLTEDSQLQDQRALCQTAPRHDGGREGESQAELSCYVASR